MRVSSRRRTVAPAVLLAASLGLAGFAAAVFQPFPAVAETDTAVLTVKTLDAMHAEGLDADWYVTRHRTREEVLPWSHIAAGLHADFLWDDWQSALQAHGLPDCRWTPCYDCGVCPEMGTEIQIGPTGQKLLPLSVV